MQFKTAPFLLKLTRSNKVELHNTGYFLEKTQQNKLNNSTQTQLNSKQHNKLWGILDNANHPQDTVISSQRSQFSDRLLLPKSQTNRLRNSFVPRAIKLFIGQ